MSSFGTDVDSAIRAILAVSPTAKIEFSIIDGTLNHPFCIWLSVQVLGRFLKPLSNGTSPARYVHIFDDGNAYEHLNTIHGCIIRDLRNGTLELDKQ
jgi:hypothetical protein